MLHAPREFRLRRLLYCACLATSLLLAQVSMATIFGRVEGVVHDPQHRPLPGATVKISATTSDWTASATTDDHGEFRFLTVPVGDYQVAVTRDQFATSAQPVTVRSDAAASLHFQLALAGLSQSATVSAEAASINMDSVTPTTLVDRNDIDETPGASRTNSLAMITDFTPGAYVTHDMLHMRGGHQVDWLIDGVPIPNTNIATNLGPQIDPKDVDYLEVQRGSYDAQYGDRTYGVFNIVPRTGFEGVNEGSLFTSFGNWNQTNDQVSFSSHTNRFAYYASVNANRSDYGLQPPIGHVVHDAENGFGGFASFIFNASARNQFRLVTSIRRDFYQIPIDPDPNSAGNQIYSSAGLHDSETEPDGYVTFSWVHTFTPGLRLTLSPFYHYNSANYASSPNDIPVITDVKQTANYAGGQANLQATVSRNDVEAGFYGFAQHQSNYFNNIFTGCAPDCLNYGPSSAGVTGAAAELFVSDRLKVTSWLTLIAGIRYTHFDSGTVSGSGQPGVVESVPAPRLGASLRIPKINWVFHGFWGEFYQPPPLLTATGPLQSLATSQSLTFSPLRGERDHEYQFGVSIPLFGWTLEEDTFQTSARNWLDHSNIGESNIFWPLTWDRALIEGWETTLRSPRAWRKVQVHLSYSNQIAQASAPFTGGLICPLALIATCEPPPGLSPVDHDQRNTLSAGASSTLLPGHVLASLNVYYGSGFTNGEPDAQYPGAYLPGHTSVDLSLGKSFGENDRYRISVTALNVSNRRVLLDNSLTFGGFHYNDPRQIFAEFRWKFHY